MGSKAEKKIVIVGKYCVGKTSLVHRFANKRFRASSESTIGAAYTARKVKLPGSKSFRLGIWDTAGSERFESMTSLYYRGAKAVAVCYDITDDASFEKAKSYVDKLKVNVPDCLIYLCGTKNDLVNTGERLREVIYDEVVKYGRKINARAVIETSSKTGHNVDGLFWRIAKDLLEETSPGHARDMGARGLKGQDKALYWEIVHHTSEEFTVGAEVNYAKRSRLY